MKLARTQGDNGTHGGLYPMYTVEDDTRFLYVAAIYTLLLVVSAELPPLVCHTLALQSSKTLHRQMFRRVLGSPVTFFESNPLGGHACTLLG